MDDRSDGCGVTGPAASSWHGGFFSSHSTDVIAIVEAQKRWNRFLWTGISLLLLVAAQPVTIENVVQPRKDGSIVTTEVVTTLLKGATAACAKSWA